MIKDMAELDKELEAINQILKALETLEVDEKKRVIEYCLTRLGLKVASSDMSVASRREPLPAIPDISSLKTQSGNLATDYSSGAMIDIRTLRNEKDPKSAIEMAAVVAFYLSELAPDEQRKSTIAPEDINKYFKQASFKLPKGSNGGAVTLRNAKNAGYFDAAGEMGSYKLNPVGYNLVAYNLPKSSSSSSRPAQKRTAPKKVVAKKRGATKKKGK